jgi:hypothetical protein
MDSDIHNRILIQSRKLVQLTSLRATGQLACKKAPSATLAPGPSERSLGEAQRHMSAIFPIFVLLGKQHSALIPSQSTVTIL